MTHFWQSLLPAIYRHAPHWQGWEGSVSQKLPASLQLSDAQSDPKLLGSQPSMVRAIIGGVHMMSPVSADSPLIVLSIVVANDCTCKSSRLSFIFVIFLGLAFK